MKTDESPTPAPAPRSFAERLFTPENVRILQSLGIGIIFISAIALVRNQMWSGATNLERLGILIGGTAICYGVGSLLYKWTSLRITGLGFLILGHLAMILDAYAALILPDTGQRLYPYSPASLWACTFMLFTATAYVHARYLKEPLFDAFTLFGGLAAWASCGCWAEISPALIPATFVPAILIARGLASGMRFSRERTDGQILSSPRDESQQLRRWSLEWWLKCCWLVGSHVLAAVLIGAAVFASFLLSANAAQNELAMRFSCHAAALAGLGMAMLAQNDSGIGTTYAGSLLLLVIAPFAAYAFNWPLEWMQLALSAPGAALVLAALGIRRAFSGDESGPRMRCNAASDLALVATMLGALLALAFYLDVGSPLVLWTTLCATVASVTYALARRLPLGAWLSTAAAGLLALAIAQKLGSSSNSVPLALLGIAALLRLLWHVASRRELLAQTARHGGASADVLALFAGLRVFTLSTAVLGFGLPLPDSSLACGWLAASAYVLISSLLERKESRRSIALGLLSPALACTLYAHGISFGAAAPFVALLALAVFATESWWNRAAAQRATILPGTIVVGCHALCLSAFQYATGQNESAAIAFAFLAALGVGASLQMRLFKMSGVVWFESASLGLVSLACLNMCAQLGVSGGAWPAALILLAALIVLLALAAESLAGLMLQALHAGDAPSVPSGDELQRPFHVAGEAMALLLSTISLEHLVVHGAQQPNVWYVVNGGLAALLMAFLAIRPALTRRGEPVAPAGGALSVIAGILSAIFFIIAFGHAIGANFWLQTCTPSERNACAIFFAATLSASVLAGGWLRRAFSPVTGMLAMLGLAGCAYGALHLPVESFGLACAILAVFGTCLSLRLRKCEALLRSGLLAATEFSTGSVALSAAFFMATGLCSWSPGALHAYSVAAWLVLAGIATLGAPGGLSAWRTFFAAIAAGFAACHVMRWMGLDFVQFGPALSACALLTLAVREMTFLAPRDLEDSQAQDGGTSAAGAGLLLASAPLALLGFGAGAYGAWFGHEWEWCATLAECALYFAVLTVTLRRFATRDRVLVLGIELGAWLLGALAVNVAAHASGLEITGVAWALLGAISTALGMAAESVAGALLWSERHSRTPTPFLESRHIAAAGLALFGVAQVIFVGAPLDHAHCDATWRALFGAAVIAIYLSMSAWSTSSTWREPGRAFASFAAYIVLIPATYLCFLKAHSTGSPWAALWFMLLAPVMYGAIYVLEREKQAMQANMAKFSVAIVNIGALILAFLGNREHLAAVPAATCALIAAQAWFARKTSGLHELTWAACLASTGAVFYALRAAFGIPATGALEPFAFEMPALAAWAAVLVALGGALRLDEDETGTSRVGNFGGGLAGAAIFDSVLNLIFRGPTMHSTPVFPLARVDALIMCLLFGAASAISARRWMRFESGKYLAPAATLIAYAMFVLKSPVTYWEWITVPVALFLFLWARQQADDESESGSEVSILLGLASSFALIPSFIQAMPYEPAALWHAAALLAAGFAMVMGAMFARRKIPLLAGSGAMLLLTLVKTLQWAAHRELFLPLVGITIGFGILAMGSVFEARMNRLIRETLGRAKAEARMFWVSWN